MYPRAQLARTDAAAVTVSSGREREEARSQLHNALLSPLHCQLQLRDSAPTQAERAARDSIACSNEYYLLEPRLSREITTQVPPFGKESDGYNRKQNGPESNPKGASFASQLMMLRGNEQKLKNLREERSRSMQASQKPVSYV